MKKTRKIFSIITVVALLLTIAGAQVSVSAGSPEMVKVIISFHEAPGQAEKTFIKNAGGIIKHSYKIIPAIAGSVPGPALKGLSKNPKIKIIEMDAEIYALDLSTEQTLTWGVDRIDADIVHSKGNQGAGIKVAILDSGIDYTHLDLEGNYGNELGYGGYDFVNDDSDPMDDNGHGTHVAGTIAAEDNTIGVIGVAPEAEIYAYKILNENGSGDISTVIIALEQAVADGIQVTNNSYGTSANVWAVENAFAITAANGMIHVAAAGNFGNRRGVGDNVGYPARYDSVIAVAATDSNDVRARFSSTGSAVEISAPGVGVISTYPGGYAIADGTSMASPHVAGTVALMLKSEVNSGDIRERLQNTADYLGDSNWYGSGLVNADEAVLDNSTPNNSPVANNQSAVINEDAAVTIILTATDADNDALAYSIVDSPSNGILSGIAPNVTYTPNENYNGPDSFTFKVNDGTVDSNIATVNITINPVNDAPIAEDQLVTTNEDTNINITLTATDPDDGTLAYSIVESPSHGILIGTLPNITYTPADGYEGVDSFTFKTNDGTTDSNIAVVNITVNPVNLNMSVDSIVVSTNRIKLNGWYTYATAIVTILNDNKEPVEGASVSGHWSGLTGDSDSGITDGDGQITIDSDKVKNADGTFVFTVDSVTKSDWTYYSDTKVSNFIITD